MEEDWFEPIDDKHVRIKKTCTLTLLEVVRTISRDHHRRRFIVGNDWSWYLVWEVRTKDRFSLKFETVNDEVCHIHMVGSGNNNRACLAFLLGGCRIPTCRGSAYFPVASRRIYHTS